MEIDLEKKVYFREEVFEGSFYFKYEMSICEVDPKINFKRKGFKLPR